MFILTSYDFNFIGLLFEGFLYGLYTGIFTMYLQYCASKKETSKTQNVIFYSICALYVLSSGLFVFDIAGIILQLPNEPMGSTLVLRIYFIQTTLFACCDVIAQFILIYRCWIVWGRNIRVVIIPSTLAFAFLVTWLAGSDSEHILSDQFEAPGWASPVLLSSLAMSLTVNALVMALIVFRIFRVFREVKVGTSDDQILGATGGSKLRRIIFILIESGMALFSIQLARVVVSIVKEPDNRDYTTIVITIHEMLTGITPTIILVRTSMGLSFDDEKSMEEVAIGSLRFVSSHPNSVPETGSVRIVGQDSRNDGDIGIQKSDEIEVVER